MRGYPHLPPRPPVPPRPFPTPAEPLPDGKNDNAATDAAVADSMVITPAAHRRATFTDLYPDLPEGGGTDEDETEAYEDLLDQDDA